MSLDEFSLPAAKHRPGRLVAKLWAAIHGVLWLTFVLTLYTVVPRFDVIYKDFGIPLPSVTVIALGLSHLVVRYVAVVVVLFATGMTGDAVTLDHLFADPFRQDRARRWAWWMTVIPLIGVFLLLAVLIPPLLGLMSRLSG